MGDDDRADHAVGRTALVYASRMGRPAVDVVVPFKGSAAELSALRNRLAGLETGPGDSVTVVDNAPGSERVESSEPRGGSGDPRGRDRHAELCAQPGRGAWQRGVAGVRGRGRDRRRLTFSSATSTPLLRRRTGLLAGGVKDAEVPPGGPGVARYAYIRQFMSQADTLRFGDWGFAKTANLACRRAAFEEVGGFRDHIRAGEDADLTFRLRAAGWAFEQREGCGGGPREPPDREGLRRPEALSRGRRGVAGSRVSGGVPGARVARAWSGGACATSPRRPRPRPRARGTATVRSGRSSTHSSCCHTSSVARFPTNVRCRRPPCGGICPTCASARRSSA